MATAVDFAIRERNMRDRNVPFFQSKNLWLIFLLSLIHKTESVCLERYLFCRKNLRLILIFNYTQVGVNMLPFLLLFNILLVTR